MRVDIPEFLYKYLEGPVEDPKMIDAGITTGNCRLALQLYFYKIHNKFFGRDEIYLPGGYKSLGEFIHKEETVDFDELKEGDIIFAQNLRGKGGDLLKKAKENFETHDDWLYHLHSAIYLGKHTDSKHYIWHATNIEGKSVVWDLDKFTHYYLPISSKRVI